MASPIKNGFEEAKVGVLNPIDQTLLFIKRFSILRHKRENQPVLRVVTPILVNSDFTFQQA